jgi:hypothetical protein
MKRFAVFLILSVSLVSCASFQKPKTLGEAKADLDCTEYRDGEEWKQISGKFGTPDLVPLPEPGAGLTKNSRAYSNMVIFFYTEVREVREGERVRFHEVITSIDVCKKK